MVWVLHSLEAVALSMEINLLLIMYHPIIISLIQNEIQAMNKDLLKHMVVSVLMQETIEMTDRMHVQGLGK
jgi:hypothetical protein